ncbi:MAG: hypothetical protein U9N34_02545 [Candidatus Cloacimonadota bacterium]|nr:hypothetical protein [Candidatus Cloacimonadota bacterium]
MLNKPEKEFKVMDWLRTTRDSIYEETKKMNSDERINYFKTGSNQFNAIPKKRDYPEST